MQVRFVTGATSEFVREIAFHVLEPGANIALSGDRPDAVGLSWP